MINYILGNAGVVGLLFFFVFFVVMVTWLFRPNSKNVYESYGEMPLRENEDV